MKFLKMIAPAALVCVSAVACQQNTSDSNIAVGEVNDMAKSDLVVPPNSGEPANVAMEPTEPGKAPLPTAIPATFQGRWGLTMADCTSTKGDAKGLLTISDARLTFYESKGTLDKVLGATDTSFDGNYGFRGEGQEWERVERFKMVDAKLNRRTDAAAGQEPPVDLTYMRCPS